MESTNNTYHKSGLQKQLAEMTRLVGELKHVRAEGPRKALIKDLDVAIFAALGHLRGLDG